MTLPDALCAVLLCIGVTIVRQIAHQFDAVTFLMSSPRDAEIRWREGLSLMEYGKSPYLHNYCMHPPLVLLLLRLLPWRAAVWALVDLSSVFVISSCSAHPQRSRLVMFFVLLTLSTGGLSTAAFTQLLFSMLLLVQNSAAPKSVLPLAALIYLDPAKLALLPCLWRTSHSFIRALLKYLGNICLVAACVVAFCAIGIGESDGEATLDPSTTQVRALQQLYSARVFLHGSNLVPGLGLQWYFFQLVLRPYEEMCHWWFFMLPLVLCVPVFLKLRHTFHLPYGRRFYVVLMQLVLLLHAPYLTLSELLFYFSVAAVVHPPILIHMRYRIALFSTMALSIPLSVAFREAWLRLQVANSNYVFLAAVAINVACALAVCQMLRGYIRSHRCSPQHTKAE